MRQSFETQPNSIKEDDPRFVQSFNDALVIKIAEKAFPAYFIDAYKDIMDGKVAEPSPDAYIDMVIYLHRETKNFKTIDEFREYCSEHHIRFLSEEEIKELKRKLIFILNLQLKQKKV